MSANEQVRTERIRAALDALPEDAEAARVPFVIASIGRFIGFTRVGDTLEGADPEVVGSLRGRSSALFIGYANAMRLVFDVGGGSLLQFGASIHLTLASARSRARTSPPVTWHQLPSQVRRLRSIHAVFSLLACAGSVSQQLVCRALFRPGRSVERGGTAPYRSRC